MDTNKIDHLRHTQDNLSSEWASGHEDDAVRLELKLSSEKEFAAQMALADQIADLALIAGDVRTTSIKQYNHNAPWKYEDDEVAYRQTPLYIDKNLSDTAKQVGYYLNSWDGTNYVEVRMVTQDIEASSESYPKKSDVLLGFMGGTISHEFSNENGDLASFEGPIFEVPTRPINQSQPFVKLEDDPVAIESTSSEFKELKEVVRQMSTYYRRELQQ